MGRSAPTSHDGAVASYELQYDLNPSRPASLYTINDAKHPSSSTETSIPQPSFRPNDSPEPTALQPSVRLMFSPLSLKQRLCVLTPALASSIIAGGIAPFMTLLVGQTFAALAAFPVSSNPSQEDKAKLLHDVGVCALGLLGLAVGSILLGSLTSSLWVMTGENNVMALRRRVYKSVSRKDMAWFDAAMGSESSAEGESAPQGAGGFMAKFSRYANSSYTSYADTNKYTYREADELRMASSLASGMLVQYITTCIACLVIGFVYSWSLTLVVLSAVPGIVLVQAIGQATVGPLLAASRKETAVLGTLIERALNAIATVKAFNAQSHEYTQVTAAIGRMTTADVKCNVGWGSIGGSSQFFSMVMFVQGFWFGSKLVRDGSATPGDVMSVFWACLIASSNMQMCLPQLMVLNKGKFAVAELLTMIGDDGQGSVKKMKPVVPAQECTGEMALQNVTFSYPSRPTIPVLLDVSIYLPARDLTFIVGGSGSGKSTISHLLMRMYEPKGGKVLIDNQEASVTSPDWIRAHVASVTQGCFLFDMSVHDNVAMGLAGNPNGRSPLDVTREEVVAACTAALMHDFIRDLPDGYDTKLGNGGANLSGGQRQRLSIARAYLRDPTVLIMGMCFQSLILETS